MWEYTFISGVGISLVNNAWEFGALLQVFNKRLGIGLD